MAARRIERLTDLKKQLEEKYGVQVTPAALDIGDADSCDAFYDSLPADLRDNIDVLVNNAGVGALPGPVYAIDWSEVEKVINVNVKGVVKMLKLFVPGMLKRGSGHIISTSSTVGKDSAAMIGIYSGSKHMLEAINTSLRAELVATPLRVSLVSPGITHSEFADALGSAASKFYEGFKPLESADIAEDIVYTASRPEHVQVVDIHTVPSAQASLHLVHREGGSGGFDLESIKKKE